MLNTVVIGCGNLLRGDDAVGPVLIRHLWEKGVPPTVRLVDGGTAGMDVAFQMRGANRVILIDACQTGSSPGTRFRVPGEELEQLPPLSGLHSHQFRWDHALAFARWLLKDDYPQEIEVHLVEAGDVSPGMTMTPEVDQAMRQLLEELGQKLGSCEVTFMPEGVLRMEKDLAERYFPHDLLVPLLREGQLWLLPTNGPQAGGLILKQRNTAGQRSVLLREFFAEDPAPGRRPAYWDEERGALRVALP